MRTTSIGSDNGQRLINQAPTLPKHIATKEYVDQTTPTLLAEAIGNSLNAMEDSLTDQIDAFQASVNAQIVALQSAVIPPTAVPLTAGEPADLAVGDYFVLTANGNQTITLTNIAALGGRPKVIVFDIRNTSTLNVIWNIPGLTFSRGTPVPLTPNGRDILTLTTKDGTAWEMSTYGLDFRSTPV